jgi:isoleucyl-tRNA synthetase
MMSPIAPFYGDWLYKNMTDCMAEKSISVHLTDYPVVKSDLLNPDLEASMDLAQRICSMVHAMRKSNRLKVRQPLSKILIPVLNQKTRDYISSVDELIKMEVNVKEVAYLDDASGVLSKKIKPNFKALGPKFGKDMKNVAEIINNLTAEDLKTLEEEKTLVKNQIYLTLEDVEILTEDLPGYLTASDNGLTAALDINITPALKQEGIARDFVNRIQNLRKDLGFEVTDKIQIDLKNTNAEITEGVQAFKSYICQEVQALSLNIVNDLSDANAIEIDEVNLEVSIKVI